DFTGAERVIAKALRLFPDHGALLLLNVRLLREQGLLKEAELLASRCRSTFPQAPDFEVELAHLDVLKGVAEVALARMTPILARDPG
ncbi:hypothetical protein, partial [Stenotrophomonas maltophilia]|uniref:hypothetical protein n=1 Tax=Stenotrophomonas maltophilia TaxID=40324 RepID=UPI0013D9DF28